MKRVQCNTPLCECSPFSIKFDDEMHTMKCVYELRLSLNTALLIYSSLWMNQRVNKWIRAQHSRNARSLVHVAIASRVSWWRQFSMHFFRSLIIFLRMITFTVQVCERYLIQTNYSFSRPLSEVASTNVRNAYMWASKHIHTPHHSYLALVLGFASTNPSIHIANELIKLTSVCRMWIQNLKLIMHGWSSGTLTKRVVFWIILVRKFEFHSWVLWNWMSERSRFHLNVKRKD